MRAQFTLAGEVADFDEAAFRTRLATYSTDNIPRVSSGVAADDITLTVTAGTSTRRRLQAATTIVAARIVAPSNADATLISNALTAVSTYDISTDLGVTVQSVANVATSTEIAPAPPPSSPPTPADPYPPPPPMPATPEPSPPPSPPPSVGSATGGGTGGGTGAGGGTVASPSPPPLGDLGNSASSGQTASTGNPTSAQTAAGGSDNSAVLAGVISAVVVFAICAAGAAAYMYGARGKAKEVAVDGRTAGGASEADAVDVESVKVREASMSISDSNTAE